MSSSPCRWTCCWRSTLICSRSSTSSWPRRCRRRSRWICWSCGLRRPQFCWSRTSSTRQMRCCWDHRLHRPPAAVAASTAPPLEQPPSLPSPPAARVNMFAHTAEAGGEAEVDLNCRMSVLMSSVIGHLLEGDPSLHRSGQFRPSRSPIHRP
jgi:hypothetical protein